jgi:cellulose biosynthesis protein BcsQ
MALSNGNSIPEQRNCSESSLVGVSFNLLVIASTPDRASILQAVAIDTQKLLPTRVFSGYPNSRDLLHQLDSAEPELVLLDLADPDAAADCAAQVYLHVPYSPILGIEGVVRPDPSLFGQALSTILPYPPDVADLIKALDESILRVRSRVEPNMLAFVPSKGGSGASTIVLYTAATLAGHFSKRVLVIDGDLRSSALSIMLGREEFRSVQDVLRSAAELDRFRLDQCITHAHGFDLLLSNRTAVTPTWQHYFRLLDLVRSLYDVVLVDLPELVNPATRELLRRSRRVFTICTPEVVSLTLAERRCEELSQAGIPEDRVHILLNRWHADELKPGDIEQFLHRPIMHVFPNDYKTVRAATVEGRLIPAGTRLGKAFQEFAGQLIGSSPVKDAGLSTKLRGVFSRHSN